MFLDKDTVPPTLRLTEADDQFAREHREEETRNRLVFQSAALLGQFFRESGTSEAAFAMSVPGMIGNVMCFEAIGHGSHIAMKEFSKGATI